MTEVKLPAHKAGLAGHLPVKETIPNRSKNQGILLYDSTISIQIVPPYPFR